MKCGMYECPAPSTGSHEWCADHGAALALERIEQHVTAYERFRSHMRYLGDPVTPAHAAAFDSALAFDLDRLFAYTEGALG